ncbi:MAG TPA: archaeosortase/exosortase family protein [Candidatus Hydrogenedentes bacterium]|nr:archaeosortase/exosortase family protein [Candidatus Hydrogenedentota bacterium]HOL78280.1 archaeosortase/exosortase family protein [Candidatus Hydrogenedentota bacterium]HPO87459.1 archaeosortase/exosortase family protein [Candidatus Hydrogenedentota bacterium]
MTPTLSQNELQPLPRLRNLLFKHPRVRFVLLFLTYCLVILAIYRSLTLTVFNQAYLFSIAQCTSILLRVSGVYAEIESVATYRGRESEIRRLLTKTSSFPVGHPDTDTLGRMKPITAWEVYRFRTARIQSELLEVQKARKELEKPFRPVVVHSPEEHVRAIEERLAQIRNPIFALGNQRLVGVIDAASRKELDAIAQTLKTARTLTSTPTDKFVQMLQDVDQKLGQLRALFADSLATQAARLQKNLLSLGPTVYLRPPNPDNTIARPPFVFSIAPECGAVEVFAIFIAGVLALPYPMKKRFLGIVLGVPLLYIINIFRLSILGYIGVRYSNPEMFRFVHEYLWQGLYVVFAAALWLAWTEYIAKTDSLIRPRAPST